MYGPNQTMGMFDPMQPSAPQNPQDGNMANYGANPYGPPMMAMMPPAMYGNATPYMMGGNAPNQGAMPGVPYTMGPGWPSTGDKAFPQQPPPATTTKQTPTRTTTPPPSSTAQKPESTRSATRGHKSKNKNRSAQAGAAEEFRQGSLFDIPAPQQSSTASKTAPAERTTNATKQNSMGSELNQSYVVPPSSYGVNGYWGQNALYGSTVGGNVQSMYMGASEERGSTGYRAPSYDPMMAGSAYNGVGSMYGGSYAAQPGWGSGLGPGFRGSLYGGSMFGVPGALYGAGGSLYGGAAGAASMYSMNGLADSFRGGSMYESMHPHTNLGVVRKLTVPGFSYTFPSATESGTVWGSTHDANTATKTKTSAPSTKRDTATKSKSPLVLDTKSAPAAATETTTTTASPKKTSPTKTAVVPRAVVTSPAKPAEAPLSAAQTIATIIVIQTATGQNAPPTVTRQSGTTLTVRGPDATSSFDLGAVLEYDAAASEAVVTVPAAMTQMGRHFVAGHSAAFLLAVDRGADAAARAALHILGHTLFSLLEQTPDTKYMLTLTWAAVRGVEKVKDLLKPGDADVVGLELGGSPLLGPVILNLTPRPISDAASWSAATTTTTLPPDEDLLLGSLTLKQTRPSMDATQPIVLVSSLLVAVDRKGGTLLRAAAEKEAGVVPVELFRHALGGPCVTVHCGCVCADADPAAAARLLHNVRAIGAVHNAYPRSGNVERFITFTEQQHARLAAQVRTMPAGDQATTVQKNLERTRLILNDTKALLQHLSMRQPKSYRAPTKRDDAHRTTALDAKPSTVALVPALSTAAMEDGATRAVPAAVVVPAASGVAQHGSRARNLLRIVVTGADTVPGVTLDRTHDPPVITTADGASFDVGALVPRLDDAALNASPDGALTQTTRSFVGGCNTALIALESGAKADPYESPAWVLVRHAVRTALAHKAAVKTLRVSFALLRERGEALDLLQDATSEPTWSKLVVATSPLFGPTVHNAAPHALNEAADFDDCLRRARAATAGRWSSDTLLHVVFVFFYSTGTDAFVASLAASFGGANAAVYRDMLERHTALHEVCRYALSGTAATTCVLTLDHATAAQTSELLRLQQRLAPVLTRPMRSGSLNEFVKYTRALLERRRARAAETTDLAERAQQERVIAPMAQMLDDHERCLRDPTHVVPGAYAPATTTATNAAATHTAPRGEPESAFTNNNTAAPPPSTTDRGAMVTPNPSSMPSASTTAPRTRATPYNTPAPQTGGAMSVAPNGVVSAAESAAMVSAPARAARVVVLRDKASPDTRVVAVNGTEFVVDEVLTRISGVDAGARYTAQSDSLRALTKCVDAGLNCAVVSASTIEAAPGQEAVWVILFELARSALQSVRDSDKVNGVLLDVSFTLLSGSEMLADLLAENATTAATPPPIEICSSPLSGRHVGGVTLARAATVTQLEQLFTRALDAAARYQGALHRRGALLLGSVMQRRRMVDGDVVLASMTGMLTGAAVTAYAEVLEQRQCLRRKVLSGVFTGPCTTVLLVNLEDKAGSATEETVSVMHAMSKKFTNIAHTCGSVRHFLKYAEANLQREQAKTRPGGTSSKAENMQKMIQDYRNLLVDFVAPHPSYTITPTRGGAGDSMSMKFTQHTRSPGSNTSRDGAAATDEMGQTEGTKRSGVTATPLHTVVFVTEQRGSSMHSVDTPPGATPTVRVSVLDARHVVATQPDGTTTLKSTFDEVVSRPSRSSVVRSEHLVHLVEHVTSDHHGALVLYDVPGSSIAIPAAEKVVHGVLASVEKGNGAREVYYSLALIKDGERVKDMGATAATGYVRYEAEPSPFVGLAVRSVRLHKLSDTAQFDLAFTTAVAEAKNERAVCLATVVLKQILDEGKDVRFTSLLIGVSSEGATSYERMVHDTAPTHGLVRHLLGGAHYRVAVLGLPNKVDANEAQKALTLFDSLQQHRLTGQDAEAATRFLDCSVRQYLERSASYEMELLQQCAETDTAQEDKLRDLKARVERVQRLRRDAKRILGTPATNVPADWE